MFGRSISINNVVEMRVGASRGYERYEHGHHMAWHRYPKHPRTVQIELCRPEHRLRKDQKMGHVLLGSANMMLSQQGNIAFNEDWSPQRPVRFSERMDNRPA